MTEATITVTMAVLAANHQWAEVATVLPVKLLNGGIVLSEDAIEEKAEEALLAQEPFRSSPFLIAMTLLHWEITDHV